jgi:hypothetical protein
MGGGKGDQAVGAALLRIARAIFTFFIDLLKPERHRSSTSAPGRRPGQKAEASEKPGSLTTGPWRRRTPSTTSRGPYADTSSGATCRASAATWKSSGLLR